MAAAAAASSISKKSQNIGASTSISNTATTKQQHRFQLKQKLGEGGFGKIYLAYDNIHKRHVAIKKESRKAHASAAQLQHEHNVYLRLGINTSIAEVFEYDDRTDPEYRILVMQVLGPNLELLFGKCKRKFTLKTVCMIGISILSGIEFIHSRGLVHKDLKPENIVIRPEKGRDNELLIIDFGLSSSYLNPDDESKHIKWEQRNVSIDGTARYASSNAHYGIVQSRRDDLISLGNVLIYFSKGRLPWQGLNPSRNKYEHISDLKTWTDVDSLTAGLDPCFASYMKVVRGLKFDETPDYNMLQTIFQNAIEARGSFVDWKFDWTLVTSFLKSKGNNNNNNNNNNNTNSIRTKAEVATLTIKKNAGIQSSNSLASNWIL